MVSVRSGNQVKNWLEEIILVEADEDFHIVFEAETGTSQDTYIALDDVSLTPVRFIDDVFGVFLHWS